MGDDIPQNVDDLLSRIDEDTAYRIGKQMGALYHGFVHALRQKGVPQEEENDSKMWMLLSFMMAYQIGTKK